MDNTRPHRKLLRSPSLKRRSKALPINQRVQLQRVLGVTVSSNAGLSCDSNSGTIAYPAGCVVVLFNPRKNKQSHIFNATKKPVTCLAFSRDGKYLITGETGHQPAVRIWDVLGKMQVAEFRGHKFGISCVAFSPNMKEVVSVGIQHDMMVNVWNWKTGNKVASNKVSSKVSALAFSEDGKCFITVGNRHVRFWYLEDKKSKINQTVPLMGRSGILGNQKDNFFCDVVAGRGQLCGRFFVITQSGLLCEFNEKRQLDKWVELMTKTANCINAGQDHIFVGCAEGVIRVFNATSLQFICSLPKPHHLGVEVTTATNPSHMVNKKEDAKYPDTKAIVIDDNHKKVTCIYNDKSVYTWDVHDIKRAGKIWSFLYHSGCIWSLEMYPTLEDETKAMLPPGSFLTASADDTIRMWNLTTHLSENTTFKKNIYSNELLKIVYADPSLTSLCSVNYNPAGGTDKTDTSYEGKNGVRSIRISPDGADLASGDRQGNIRIYSMQHLSEKKCIEAHESDVMCLEYSYSRSGRFLATSSRDRLIHVFDVDENYGLVQSLGDHSSSITAVRFTDVDNKLQMISCGADKSILIRNAVSSPDFQFQLEHHLATKITLYDMVIDPTQRFLATACQDRNVRLYNIQTTKEKKCYRGSVGDEGVLLRMHLDPSGSYAATTGTDKNVCIVDFHTGELVATMYGHSEVITGVKFANDLKHLITVSADGCIFVWRLPSEMTKQIKVKLQELGKPVKETDYIKSEQPLSPNSAVNSPAVDKSIQLAKSVPTGNKTVMEDNGLIDDEANHRSLGVGQLPNWAKVKFGEIHSKGPGSGQEQLPPKGKWAQRADSSLELKSQLDVTALDDTFSDQHSFVESGFNTLPRIRRKTVILCNREEIHNLPHVDDSFLKSAADLHSSLPTTTKFSDLKKIDTCDQYKSDTSLNMSAVIGKQWADRFSLGRTNSIDDGDDLDTESDTAEIIYPPTDSDIDLFASTYKVFAVDDGKNKNRCSKGSSSTQDEASVSTDSVEDEDYNEEAVVISGSTSPSALNKEFLPGTPEKEEFVRETFVEDSFTPVPLNKFARSVNPLTSLGRQVTDGVAGFVFESTPFSPRMSLSARFMSRAQSPGLKSFAQSPNTSKQDNWFSRNRRKLVRSVDETRRSLLAMKLSSDSCDSDSLEKEDSPSPPIKLKDEVISFPDASQARRLCSTSPPTETEINLMSNLQGMPISQLKVNNQSPLKVSPTNIASLSNLRCSEETDIGKSNVPPKTGPKRSSSVLYNTSSKCAAKTEQTCLKPTKVLKNKSSEKRDLTSKSEIGSNKFPTLYNRKLRRQDRLRGSKLYASTPNLLDFEAGDNICEGKTQTLMKCISVIDLQLLPIMPLNEPDASEAGLNIANSSRVPHHFKPMIEYKQIQTENSFDAIGKQVISASQPIPIPSHAFSTQTAHSSILYIKDAGGSRQSYKKSTSEIIVAKTTSHHSSKSAVLIDSNTVTCSPSRTSKSLTKYRDCDISNLSSSAKSTDFFPAAFDCDLIHASPALLAVTDTIEQNVSLLNGEKQAYSCDTFSEFRLSSQPSHLDASPLDLPERDKPNKQSQQELSLLLQHPNHRPQTFQHSVSSSSQISSADRTYLISADDHAKDSDNDLDECKAVCQDKSLKCDCVTFHDSHSLGREAVNYSAYCHTLPTTTRNLSVIQESQSDTGVSSGSSDTDISHISLEISTPGTKNKSMKIETLRPRDTTEMTLELPLSLPPLQVSATHCQSLLCDFKSRLHVLRDLHSQVYGRTDDTSLQVSTMLGNVFHEAQDIIADLVSQRSGHAQGNRETHSLKLSSPVPSSCCDKTFHFSSPTSDETTPVNCNNTFTSLEDNSIKEATSLINKGSILLATNDMLQPIVSQLSQDLSEGVWKLIRERLDEALNVLERS